MKAAPRLSLLVLGVLAVVGIACLALNLHSPIVRNSLVYARAAEHVIAHGFDPRPVVADSLLSYDKPIGFAWLASPIVAAFGTNVGLKIASAFGAIVYLAAAWRFSRAFDPFHLSDGERARFLLFAGLGPLVAYQFWSAHPDALFAGLYLFAFSLAHAIVERPTPARVALLGAVMFAAVLLKNYGLVLLASTGLYCAWHVKAIWRAEGGRKCIVALGVLFAVLGVIVGLGWIGKNPLMRFEGEGGGVGQYGQGSWRLAALGTLAQVGLALALELHVALPFAFVPKAWSKRLVPALVCFPVPYVAGLMLFPTTFYNMRYFLPLFPFAALVCVSGLRVLSSAGQRFATIVFGATALVLMAVFNVAPLHARAAPHVPTLTVDWIGVPLSLFDNLRMPLVRQEARALEHLNASVDPDGVVYMVDVLYYRDAQQGVYERAGLIRSDIRTRYVRARDLAPEEARFWVQGRVRDPTRLERLGHVTDLGLGLYRIDRTSTEPR